MNYKIFFIIFFIALFKFPASAQKTDSIKLGTDSTLQNRAVKPTVNTKMGSKKSVEPLKDSARIALEALPRKAAIRSLILPGLGQYHNKKLWWLKVPAIYAGLISLGVAVDFNQSQYKYFLKEAQYRQANNGRPLNPLYAKHELTGILTIKDGYRRNRDVSFLGIIAVYAVNAIDAYVTAKFFRFDISEDLSLNVQPSILNKPDYANAYIQPLPALKFTLSL